MSLVFDFQDVTKLLNLLITQKTLLTKLIDVPEDSGDGGHIVVLMENGDHEIVKYRYKGFGD
jgi:hypothetical protein